MYDVFVDLIGIDPASLVSDAQTIIVVGCVFLICLGVFFVYHCCDRIFLR